MLKIISKPKSKKTKYLFLFLITSILMIALLVGGWSIIFSQQFQSAYLQNDIVKNILIEQAKKKDAEVFAKNTETLNKELNRIPQSSKANLEKASQVVQKKINESNVIAGSFDFVISSPNTTLPVISVILGVPGDDQNYTVYVYSLVGVDGNYAIDEKESFATQSIGYSKQQLIEILQKTNLVAQPSPDETKLRSRTQLVKEQKESDEKAQQAKDIRTKEIKEKGVDFYKTKIVSGEIKKGENFVSINEKLSGNKSEVQYGGSVIDQYKLIDDKYPQYTYITFEYSVKYIRYDDVKGDINEYNLKSIYFQKTDNTKEYILQ
jgi:hypothetical protein